MNERDREIVEAAKGWAFMYEGRKLSEFFDDLLDVIDRLVVS